MPTVFLDTNIHLYRLDLSQPEKRNISVNLIKRHVSEITVSVQVLQEFYVNAVRNLKLSPSEARSEVEMWSRRRVIQPTSAMLLSAIDTSERYRLSFWDSLVIEAAAAADASILYTEDLNAGQVVRGIRILNPFTES